MLHFIKKRRVVFENGGEVGERNRVLSFKKKKGYTLLRCNPLIFLVPEERIELS